MDPNNEFWVYQTPKAQTLILECAFVPFYVLKLRFQGEEFQNCKSENWEVLLVCLAWQCKILLLKIGSLRKDIFYSFYKITMFAHNIISMEFWRRCHGIFFGLIKCLKKSLKMFFYNSAKIIHFIGNDRFCRAPLINFDIICL